MEQPKIEIDGVTYYQVGCRKCGKGEWKIFYDGKKYFAFQCECGNTLELAKAKLQNKPDEKPIPLRMVI